MKLQRSFSILLILLVVIAGCREITVTTTINKDGSFTRVIRVNGDSSDVFKSDLPYPVDDTWSCEVVNDSVNPDRFILVYTKTYKNSKSLKKEIDSDTSWRVNLQRKIEIRKRFGFFYSYLTYRELYPAANTFTGLNFHDYLTADELLYYSGIKIPVTPNDSLIIVQAEEKAMTFLTEAMAFEIIKILEDGINKLGEPGLNAHDVKVYKDSIISKLDNSDDDLGVFIDFYKSWTGNESVEKLKSLQPPIFQELNKRTSTLLQVLGMEKYRQIVNMPGLITKTNSASLTGNQVEWDVEGNMFLLGDYEMMAESRVVNTWAFVVAGIILLLALILMIVKVK